MGFPVGRDSQQMTKEVIYNLSVAIHLGEVRGGSSCPENGFKKAEPSIWKQGAYNVNLLVGAQARASGINPVHPADKQGFSVSDRFLWLFPVLGVCLLTSSRQPAGLCGLPWRYSSGCCSRSLLGVCHSQCLLQKWSLLWSTSLHSQLRGGGPGYRLSPHPWSQSA